MAGRSESDDTLLQRAGVGDGEACRMLVERHLGRVVAFAARVLGDATEAEDVAQEVFLRLWRHAPRWRPGGALPTTWMHHVARNLCLDRLARRREAPLDAAPPPTDPRPHAAALLEAGDIGRYVNAALMQLPAQQRVAITLCHYQGLSNAEAAAVMETSVAALESLLARGRRSLRARLSEVAPNLL